VSKLFEAPHNNRTGYYADFADKRYLFPLLWQRSDTVLWFNLN